MHKNNWKPEQIHIVSILVSNYGRGTIDNRQQSYGLPSVANGLSHALTNSPSDCLSPRLRRGRAFKSVHLPEQAECLRTRLVLILVYTLDIPAITPPD